MRRFLTNIVVEFGGHAPARSHHGAAKKKAARQFAVRAQSSLGVTVCGNRELKRIGRRSACRTTHGATDPEQIDVTAHDEHGVCNTHLSRITQFAPACPAEVAHIHGNRAVRGPIPSPTLKM
jgi:hypothetical protein